MSDLSCREFVDLLGSEQPTPGGGGAAALVGAIGVALGNMVGSFTVGKKKYADVEEQIILMNEQAKDLANKLLDLIEADAVAFAPLAKAYGLPANTDKEKANKAKIMEQCLLDAASVPIQIMRYTAAAIDIIEQYALKGSVIMISDAGCAAVSCKAALEAAALNARINTKWMKERDVAEELNEQVEQLLTEYSVKATDIYQAVTNKCK